MRNRSVPKLTTSYIYITEECNLACNHCWLSAKPYRTVKYEYPTFNDYKTFIRQAIPLGLLGIKISGGEPLLRTETLQLIEVAANEGIACMVETNGTLISEGMARFFEKTKVFVAISLDGAKPETHDRQRGLKGAFEKTLNGIRTLSKYQIPLEIITAVSEDNVNEIDGVIRIISRICKLDRTRLKINPIIDIGKAKKLAKDGKLLSMRKLLSLAHKIEKYSHTYNMTIISQLEPPFHSLSFITKGLVGGGRCGFVHLLSLLPNGDISVCGMGHIIPEYTMGNIRDNVDLKRLWERNQILNDIRQKIPQRLEGVCSICMMKLYCQGGCRAHTLINTGSVTAPSQKCQALYEMGLFPRSRLLNPNNYVKMQSSN